MRPSRRVALTIHSLSGGGAERLMSQLANAWADQCQIHLVTWSDPRSDQYNLDRRVVRHGLDLQSVSRNPVYGFFANLRRVQRLRATLVRIQPDLVVSFCDQMNIVCLEAARALAGVPVWIAEHSDPAKQRLSMPWEFWRSRVYRRCAGAVAVTREIADTLARWIASEKILVIPPAVGGLSGFHHAYRETATEGANTILYVGRLSPEKQVHLLLEAWGRVGPRLKGWQLRIVGDGPERNRLETVAGGMERVNFTGWVQNPEVYYRESQLFVLCSRYEGFPMAMLEAMSFGLPGIVTPCSSGIETLKRDRHGQECLRVIADVSVAALADAMYDLASEPGFRRRMSVAARQAAERYTWDQVRPRWNAILESLL